MRHASEDEVGNLIGGPRGGRPLRNAATLREAGISEPGNQQMSADPPARAKQIVCERLGERLQPRLADVVRGVSGRKRDALLGYSVDDRAWLVCVDHARQELLHAVHRTH